MHCNDEVRCNRRGFGFKNRPIVRLLAGKAYAGQLKVVLAALTDVPKQKA